MIGLNLLASVQERTVSNIELEKHSCVISYLSFGDSSPSSSASLSGYNEGMSVGMSLMLDSVSTADPSGLMSAHRWTASLPSARTSGALSLPSQARMSSRLIRWCYQLRIEKSIIWSAATLREECRVKVRTLESFLITCNDNRSDWLRIENNFR